jgi:hypothetical protein
MSKVSKYNKAIVAVMAPDRRLLRRQGWVDLSVRTQRWSPARPLAPSSPSFPTPLRSVRTAP